MSESEPKIIEGCGCVFCDLGLEPDINFDGDKVHVHGKGAIGYSACTRLRDADIVTAIRQDNPNETP